MPGDRFSRWQIVLLPHQLYISWKNMTFKIAPLCIAHTKNWFEVKLSPVLKSKFFIVFTNKFSLNLYISNITVIAITSVHKKYVCFSYYKVRNTCIYETCSLKWFITWMWLIIYFNINNSNITKMRGYLENLWVIGVIYYMFYYFFYWFVTKLSY